MAKLSQQDIELLNELEAEGRRWIRPMDLGGPAQVNRSAFLLRMHRAGLAEQMDRGHGSLRPSYVYRISQAGRDVLTAERSDS